MSPHKRRTFTQEYIEADVLRRSMRTALSIKQVAAEASASGLASLSVKSEDGTHRFLLHREWDSRRPTLGYVMLNPSKADAAEEDPTARRCAERARRLGYGSCLLTNCFSYIATDPKELENYLQPVDVESAKKRLYHQVLNNAFLNYLTFCDKAICGWGAHLPDLFFRTQLEYLRHLDCSFACLGLTKQGRPKHPLYISYDQPVMLFKIPGGPE